MGLKTNRFFDRKFFKLYVYNINNEIITTFFKIQPLKKLKVANNEQIFFWKTILKYKIWLVILFYFVDSKGIF